MGILDKVRAQQTERRAEGERRAAERQAEAERQRAEAATQAAEAEARRQAAQERAARERMRMILGDDLADFEATTPAEAKVAIKVARLRKKELQHQKRDLASDLADVREQWRERQAGRIPTAGIPRGTTGRIVRGAIQANRRSERLQHAGQVNAFSDQRQDLDNQIMVIDRLIIEMERLALKS